MGPGRFRVTIVSQHFAPESTGNAPYVASLATGLAERGIAVRVVTTHPHYPEWRIRQGYGEWVRRERSNGVDVRRLRHYVPGRPRGIRRLLAEVSFGLRSVAYPWGRPDVVVAVSPGLFGAVQALVRAALSPRRPARAIWVQDLYSLGLQEAAGADARLTTVMTHTESASLRLADGVAVIHDRFASHAVRVLGVSQERVEVIRNWTHVTGTPAANRERRAELGWEGLIIALHAGNMGVKQDLGNVVEAARLSEARAAPIKFVLVGDGSQRAQLEELAAGVDSIEFIDPVPDEEFFSLLMSADVLLVNEKPELREMSVPSKLTSYFATGRPVVAATDRDSVTAAEVRDSGGGVRVDAGDPSALLEAVLATAEDAELSERLGRAGLSYRARTLDMQAALDHYAAWLAVLVDSRRGPMRRKGSLNVR